MNNMTLKITITRKWFNKIIYWSNEFCTTDCVPTYLHHIIISTRY